MQTFVAVRRNDFPEVCQGQRKQQGSQGPQNYSDQPERIAQLPTLGEQSLIQRGRYNWSKRVADKVRRNEIDGRHPASQFTWCRLLDREQRYGRKHGNEEYG